MKRATIHRIDRLSMDPGDHTGSNNSKIHALILQRPA
jgi:hypothetical protein